MAFSMVRPCLSVENFQQILGSILRDVEYVTGRQPSCGGSAESKLVDDLVQISCSAPQAYPLAPERHSLQSCISFNSWPQIASAKYARITFNTVQNACWLLTGFVVSVS